jgi:NAD dependent epimerase/dehydratase
MKLQGKKVLVTGADGFIGSHLTEALVRMGCSVKAFAYYNSFNTWGWLEHIAPDLKDQLEVFTGDIRDYNCVKEAVKGCDAIFHLAALIAIPYSYYAPDSYVDTNIKGTLNVLQAAREYSVKKIVHTSTSEVYGTARFVPITEEHPLQGQSPYSASKIGADQIAMSFYHSFALPVSIIRPFNTYGPRQSARAVIPTVISQIAAGMDVIKLGALTPTRDFNFVEDTVSGFIAMAESDFSIGEVINIGSNYEVSIARTVELISEVMNKEITISCDNERVRPQGSEVERLWADNSKAERLLGWRPKFAYEEGLKKGLQITADWFTEIDNLKNYKTGIYNV